jgi:hypothetical protein
MNQRLPCLAKRIPIKRQRNGRNITEYTIGWEGAYWRNWYVPIRDHTSDKWHVIGLSLDVTEAHRSKMELESKLALIDGHQRSGDTRHSSLGPGIDFADGRNRR